MNSRAQGFTLIELLIAITLLGVLSVMLFGGVRFGARVVTAASGRIDRAAELAVTYRFLQHAIEDVQLLPMGGQDGDAQAKFDGTREEVNFVTMPPAYLALGGFYVLHVGLDGTDAAHRLIVSWLKLPRGLADAGDAPLAPSVLIDRVGTVQFSYFGQHEAGQPADWVEEWISATSLPQLIRLQLTFADGGQAPDIVIAPMTATRPQE